MKAKWMKDKDTIIEGVICLQEKTFYLFDKDSFVELKLEHAEIETISKNGFIVNGFLKYDVLEGKYEYKRYYFEIST